MFRDFHDTAVAKQTARTDIPGMEQHGFVIGAGASHPKDLGESDHGLSRMCQESWDDFHVKENGLNRCFDVSTALRSLELYSRCL